MKLRSIIAGLLGAGFVMGAAPAFAGEWRLDQRQCAQVVETRFDQRDVRRNGPAVRRGAHVSRHRITVCPRNAFVYVADRWERARYAGPRRARNARAPHLALTFDRRVGLPFTTYRGRRVYIRG